MGRYFHLTQNDALVTTGDRVAPGQPIAPSGNSGASTAPHLHLDVTRCEPQPPGSTAPDSCAEALPLTFRSTRSHACGLQVGEAYRAEQEVRAQQRFEGDG